MASLPPSDVLRFVVIKRKIGEFMAPWVIPQQEEFDHIINEATQNALSTDALSSFAWADSKRGNVALYAESRMAMELFREVLRSVQAPDPLFQYETYLRESILQRYSLTVLLKPNLANIQSNNLVPILLKRNRYLKGSIRTVKVKTYASDDSNPVGVSRLDGACSISRGTPPSSTLFGLSRRITSSLWESLGL